MPVPYLTERVGRLGALVHRGEYETWRGLRPRNRGGVGVIDTIGERDRPRRPSATARHLAAQRKARAS